MAVLKQLVRDLNLDVEIRVVETVRADDGLALSSRNGRLSHAERSRRSRSPARSPRATGTNARRPRVPPGVEPDYVEVADLDGPTLALAARIGDVRLIDNVSLKGAL